MENDDLIQTIESDIDDLQLKIHDTIKKYEDEIEDKLKESIHLLLNC